MFTIWPGNLRNDHRARLPDLVLAVGGPRFASDYSEI